MYPTLQLYSMTMPQKKAAKMNTTDRNTLRVLKITFKSGTKKTFLRKKMETHTSEKSGKQSKKTKLLILRQPKIG